MKSARICRAFVLTLLFVAITSADAAAQEGGTLWSWLGIPQAATRFRDNRSNRRGNRPEREREPPLKRLADPENLESEDPAIKRAAEIKAQEDMKEQKIKAIKYLTEIGCGCYNRDGSITEALLKAMDDCTEEVRQTTVESIGEAAQGEICETCNTKNCCSTEIVQKLAEIAWEVDEYGCHVEPSERIRQAAAEAASYCCPGMGPIELETPDVGPDVEPELPEVESPESPLDEDEEGEPRSEEDETRDSGTGASAPTAASRGEPAGQGNLESVARMTGEKSQPPATLGVFFGVRGETSHTGDGKAIWSDAPGAVVVAARTVSNESGSGVVRHVVRHDQPQRPPAEQSGNAIASTDISESQPSATASTPQEQAAATVSRRRAARTAPEPIEGCVNRVDARNAVAVIQVEGDRQPRIGARFKVYHSYLMTGDTITGELEVTCRIEEGLLCRPVGATRLAKMARGDRVVCVYNGG